MSLQRFSLSYARPAQIVILNASVVPELEDYYAFLLHSLLFLSRVTLIEIAYLALTSDFSKAKKFDQILLPIF